MEILSGVAGVTYRTIPNYSGYATGTDGSVWSSKRMGNPGPDQNNGEWKRLATQKSGRGYLGVSKLRRNDGKRQGRVVHVLVLLSHVGPRPPGCDACHKNDIRDDNRLDNLYWGTRSKNVLDAYRNGNQPKRNHKGERSPRARISDAIALEILKLSDAGRKPKEISKEFPGVSIYSIYAIVHRTSFKHLSAS